jgi:hypothetical protein
MGMRMKNSRDSSKSQDRLNRSSLKRRKSSKKLRGIRKKSRRKKPGSNR